MPRLVAMGPQNQQLRRSLRPDRLVRLGRAPSFAGGPPSGGTPPEPTGGASTGSPSSSRQPVTKGFELWAVPWDLLISKSHADLRWLQGRLYVERLSQARNPLFYKGEKRDQFSLVVGEHFVIGETTFRLVEDRVTLSREEPTPVDVAGYTAAELRQTRYRNADERLEVLSNLPDVIRSTTNEEDLFSHLALLLLEGIPRARAVAIVRVDRGESPGEPAIEICHWDSREATTTSFQPSRRLILDAIELRRRSVRSIWSAASEPVTNYTISDALDWAFCTPVPGEACRGWGIYVAGCLGPVSSAASETDLRPDLKFTELVADLLGAVRDFQQLEQQQTVLGRFFSPVTLPILSSAEGEQALAPRQTEVTVLFCDLRGFSREAERAKNDLLGLLHRVSHALDVMTNCIHAYHGVIGDFQGDAALAFWGWPLAAEDFFVQACRAALEIRLRFARAARKSGDPLADFRCGIGIASGMAVAGRLGTAGKFKIDVFGPVVNLASRLEGITKQIRVPILVDETTADWVKRSGQTFRFRRLARLRPYGMEQPVMVSELLPPPEEPEVLSDEDVTRYESALDAFIAGDWESAYALLHSVPHWDQGADFLTSHILRSQRKAPLGWDGVIQLESK